MENKIKIKHTLCSVCLARLSDYFSMNSCITFDNKVIIISDDDMVLCLTIYYFAFTVNIKYSSCRHTYYLL